MIFSDGLIKTRIYLKDTSKKSQIYRCLYQIYPSFINTYKKEVSDITNEGEEPGEKTTYRQRIKTDELKDKLTLEYKFNLEHY